MSRWRIGVVVVLILLPFIALAMMGSWYLWTEGLTLWVWLPLSLLIGAGSLLGWYWQRNHLLLPQPHLEPPAHATERDEKAWKLIEARAQAAGQLDVDILSEPDHYLHTALDLAKDLATFYYPKSADPIAALTIPEILTVIELAARDMHEMVEKYLPGGHLLTVGDWRRARQVSDWYESATLMYWLVAAIISPVSAGTRFAASKVGISQPLRMLQQNLLLWFYTAYLHRLGTYLIELYSGRLRIGAQRYRELVLKERAPATDAEEAQAVKEEHITLLVLGQVKVGKSSFVNALLGEQRAQVDVLPATNQVSRYRLQPKDSKSALEVLDTVGYSHEGPGPDLLNATHDAARNSDLIFMVFHATNPARQADHKQLAELKAWFAARPDLKMPKIVGIVTHIDLLRPAMEWAPPYDWKTPTRPKEQSIASAVKAVEEQFAEYLTAVIPVCTSVGKVFGVEEGVLPVIAARLEEAQVVALLRLLKGENDSGKIRRVYEQTLSAGKVLFGVIWDQYMTPRGAEQR